MANEDDLNGDLTMRNENGEVVLLLANGGTLSSGWIDKDDPGEKPCGDYIRFEAADGTQLWYAGADEIQANPQTLINDLFTNAFDLVDVQIDTKFVQQVTVIDPDTKGEVVVEIRKLANGPMVGLDGCFLEQSDEAAYSPYAAGAKLIVHDDEPGGTGHAPPTGQPRGTPTIPLVSADPSLLARRAYAAYYLVLQNTESFEYETIGSDLAYLMGAILADTHVEFSEDKEIMRLLRERCEEDDPVWRYIDVEKEEE